ncbi:kinase-like protein [Exidia glandulosa HHB12029]|uniref:Kinase-like protein n=1 Tax=Exidia glandulosa HHB12029 TaxID=1314781 RepID=A0A165GGZ8_EXIGL|nr:kinase-like protein [Exidia glandulosa HHB12029]
MDPASERHLAALDDYLAHLPPAARDPGPTLGLAQLEPDDLAATLGDLYYALGRKERWLDVDVALEFPWFLEGRETPRERAIERARLVEMPPFEFNGLVSMVLDLARMPASADDAEDELLSSSASAPADLAEIVSDVDVSWYLDKWLSPSDLPPTPVDAGANSLRPPAARTKPPGDLTSSVYLDPDFVNVTNVNGTLYCGTYCGSPVAVKMLSRAGALAHVRILKKHTSRWSELQHPHLAPYLGHFAEDGRLGIVRPWAVDSVALALKRNTHIDRLSALANVADALAYLHESLPEPIVHGNVHLGNLLLSSGTVLLADYGVNSILDRLSIMPELKANLSADDCRYMAPELFDSGSSRTMASDVFAFALLCVELHTLQPPFAHLRHAHEVVAAISKGERPHIPKDFDPTFRTLLDDCWYRLPALRPSMSEVRNRLQRMILRRDAKCHCNDSTPPPSPDLNALGLRGLPPV